MANSDTILYNLRESGSYTVVASNSSYGSEYDSDSSAAVVVDTAGSVLATDLTGTSWRFFEGEQLTLTNCEYAVNFTANETEYTGIKIADGEIYYQDLNGEYTKVFSKPVVAMRYSVRLNTKIEGTTSAVIPGNSDSNIISHSGSTAN